MSRRRVEGAALAAVLAVGGAVPVAQWAASAATKAAPCATWTDPAGDSSTAQAPNPTGLTSDDQMDITSSVLTTTVDSLKVVITSKALSANASDAGDEFHLNFTAAGKNLQMYSDRGASVPLAGSGPGTKAGLYNFTDDVGATGKAVATYDLKASTVTITATLADLATVAGAPLKGVKLAAVETGTQDYVTGAETGLAYDDSTTTLSPVLGVACGSAASSTPTVKPSATPSPKPTTTTGGGSTAPQVSADPSKDFPKAGCTTIADPKGDSSAKVLTTAPGAPNDPDTDLTGLTLRTTTTDLVAYIGVDKLAAGPSTTDSHRFTLDFTFNGHVFAAAGSASARGSSALRDGLANSGAVGRVTQLTVDAPPLTGANMSSPSDRGFRTSGLKATFDLTNSRVVLALPIADIEKYGMAKFTGKMTAVNAKAAVDTNAISTQADSTAKDNATTSTDTWTVNDNVCFPKKK